MLASLSPRSHPPASQRARTNTEHSLLATGSDSRHSSFAEGMHLTLGTVGRKKAAARGRSRSASQLPCGRRRRYCHPVLTRLDGAVRALGSWSASAASSGGGVADGLDLVEVVLAALGEFLGLQQVAADLHEDAAACDRILDAFLALADAYGSFEPALFALKESVAELRAGLRRGDGAMVAASLRARRRAEKELCHLAAAMHHAVLASGASVDAVDSEVTGVVAEAAAATAAASEAIFLRCAAMPPDVSAMVRSTPSHPWLARLRVVPAAKKAAPLPETATVAAALQRLEEYISELESGCEKVFRSLLQTRVSLLNIHNPL